MEFIDFATELGLGSKDVVLLVTEIRAAQLARKCQGRHHTGFEGHYYNEEVKKPKDFMATIRKLSSQLLKHKKHMMK